MQAKQTGVKYIIAKMSYDLLSETLSLLVSQINAGMRAFDAEGVQERVRILKDLCGDELASDVLKEFCPSFTLGPQLVGLHVE